MATLPDAYDEAIASIIRKGYAEQVAGDTGNRWLALHTADPGDAGANEVTGLSRVAIALNEKQTLSISGSPTGGTFTITYSGQTTGDIAYNATADDVQAALEALSNIGAGNVVCTGGPLPGTAVVVEFVKALGQQSVSLMTTTDSLTGGTTPASSIVETVNGMDLLSTYVDDATSGGRITDNPAKIELGTATAGETATHASLWTAEIGGQMVISDALTQSVTYSNGQPAEITAGALALFGAGYP